MQTSKLLAQGSNEASNGTPTVALIAAPADATSALRIKEVNLYVVVAAAGGSGTWVLQNGAATIIRGSSDAVGAARIEFGDEGYLLTPGNALNLTVTGAVTTQATVSAAAVAVVDK